MFICIYSYQFGAKPVGAILRSHKVVSLIMDAAAIHYCLFPGCDDARKKRMFRGEELVFLRPIP